MIRGVFAFAIRAVLAFAVTAASVSSLAATEFYYTSSPTSFVGHGETVLVTPALGFAFTVRRNFDDGVSLAINNFSSDPSSSSWWYLDFSAPFDAPLSVGSYLGATRWPFQDAANPGLDFSGNGRGNNTLTGMFNVLEIVYAPAGGVTTFAADFLQYDAGIESWWNLGSVRYNSDIAIRLVPEPGSYAMFVMGLCALLAVRRRRNAP